MSKQELISHAMTTITDVGEFEIVVSMIEAGEITTATQIDQWKVR